MRVLVEPMWGSGAGWISRLLAGGRIEVVEIHQERNPYFGGVNPEPIRPHIDEALAMLAGGGFDLGLLLDGDADRAGAADERGTFIHQLQVMGLLMYYLLEHRGMRSRWSRRSTRRRWSAGWASATASRCTRRRSASSTSGPR
jgi:phosphomannomutase